MLKNRDEYDNYLSLSDLNFHVANNVCSKYVHSEIDFYWSQLFKSWGFM